VTLEAVYYAFELLWLEREDLRARPARGAGPRSGVLRFVEFAVLDLEIAAPSGDLYQVAGVLAEGTDKGTRMARILNERTRSGRLLLRDARAPRLAARAVHRACRRQWPGLRQRETGCASGKERRNFRRAR
jgi:hypothetical protein